MVTIFDHLVTSENDHTNLLRSVMERYPKIASIILTYLTESAISESDAEALKYRSQVVFIDPDGRRIPDLSVQGESLECLIEAKVDPDVPLTRNQREGYAKCFKDEHAPKHLCFLVPIGWKHESEIASIKQRLEQWNIHVSVHYWPMLVLEIAGQIKDDAQHELRSEIARFLIWSFGVIRWEKQEKQMLRSWSGEMYSAVKKLERTVYQLRKLCDSRGIETEEDTRGTDFYGFSIKRGKQYLNLWVGIWADAPAPLCVGYEVGNPEKIKPVSSSEEGQLIKGNRVWALPPEAWEDPARAYEAVKPFLDQLLSN